MSERDCSEWLVRFQKQYAPSVVNNAISTLRSVFAEAVTSGARFGNPAANLSRMRIRAKQLELPSREQFLRFVEEIRTAGARQSKDCANLVRFLAYSGLRLGEARFVAWSDVQFDRRQLSIRGHPITGTKGGETRYVPMIPELERMLVELRKERCAEPSNASVMRVFERHLFATICIESGVDIPTVSRWLGHKDGGALCMKTCGHLRQDHSLAQAQRVTFGVRA